MDLKYLENNYSAFPVISLLITGLVVLLLLRLLRFIIPYIAKNRNIRDWINRYFSLFELFVWVLVGLWFLPYLMRKHIYAGYGLALILFSIFIWISWFGLKDLIAGFIFRSNSGLKKADHIEIGTIKGNILKMGYRNLVLDNASGNFISLPYSQIINQPITKLSSTEIRHSNTFELITSKIDNIQKLSSEITSRVIMHPRSSLVEKPIVELIKDEKETLIFKVRIFAIENKFLSIIEEDLREYFSKQK